MQAHERDLIFFAGLVAGAVLGGIAVALMIPRNEAGPASLPTAARGLELTDQPPEVLARAQLLAQAAIEKLRTNAQDLLGPDAAPPAPAAEA